MFMVTQFSTTIDLSSWQMLVDIHSEGRNHVKMLIMRSKTQPESGWAYVWVVGTNLLTSLWCLSLGAVQQCIDRVYTAASYWPWSGRAPLTGPGLYAIKQVLHTGTDWIQNTQKNCHNGILGFCQMINNGQQGFDTVFWHSSHWFSLIDVLKSVKSYSCSI